MKTKTEHTPGPWRIWLDMDPKQPVEIVGMESDFIATVAMENTQARANAHLIAAAPELLAACEFAELVFRKPADTNPEAEIKALGQLRAAIAKARGGAMKNPKYAPVKIGDRVFRESDPNRSEGEVIKVEHGKATIDWGLFVSVVNVWDLELVS